MMDTGDDSDEEQLDEEVIGISEYASQKTADPVSELHDSLHARVEEAVERKDENPGTKEEQYILKDGDRERIAHDLSEKRYENAFDMLGLFRRFGVKDERLKTLMAQAIGSALRDLETPYETAYPSVAYGGDKYRKYVTRDGDSSMLYKYDLIKSLNLPQEELDAIIGDALDDLFANLEKELERRGSTYRLHSRPEIYTYLSRIARIQYNLKPQSPEIREKAQAAVRRMAPRCLMLDESYTLQELGNAFGVPWYEESKSTYAPEALDTLLALPEEHNQEGTVPAILRIQKTYDVPITTKRRQRALVTLRSCIGFHDDTPQKLASQFGLTEEEVRAAAADSANRAIQRSSESTHDPDDYPAYAGNAPYVHYLMKSRGVHAEEIGQLAHKAEELRIACVDCGSVHEVDRRVEQFSEELKKGKLRHYGSDIVHALVLQVLRMADRTQFQRVQDALQNSPSFETHCKKEFMEVLARKDLQKEALFDLSQTNERKVWKELFTIEKEKTRTILELHTFLEKAGLNPKAMTSVWRHCVNNSNELMPNSKKTYAEVMGTKHVFMRNVARITELEQQRSGAAKHLSEGKNWGIRMFSRYPTEVLVRQYDRDQELQTLGRRKKKRRRKCNVIIHFPFTDWNGAFEKPKLIECIARQAPKETHDLCIAEAGGRFGCMKTLLRFFKRFGFIDRAIIGGHSNGEYMRFGSNEEDVLNIKHFTLNADNQEAYKRQMNKVRKIRSILSKTGAIIFHACRSGKEGGLAEHTEWLFKIKSQGPIRPSSLENINMELGIAHYTNCGVAVESKIYAPPTWTQKLKQRFRGFLSRT